MKHPKFRPRFASGLNLKGVGGENEEEPVTLLAEESLMGLLVNLGSVCHILAGARRFGGEAKR